LSDYAGAFRSSKKPDGIVDSQPDHQKRTSAAQLASILENGLDFHRQGDFKQAEDHYRQILKAFPTNADALHLLGVLSNQKQENDAAIDLISRAIQIFPHQPVYHNNLGNALRDSGRCRQALDCYRKALLLKPDLVETLINIGITFDQLDDCEQAACAYRKAILLNPGSAEAHYNLGNTFKKQRLFDEAISSYQQAAALNPLLIEASYNLAAVLHKKGRFEGAIACLKKCIAARPDWAEAHCNLGHCYVLRGSFDDAICNYQEAIRLKPQLDEAHSYLTHQLQYTCNWHLLKIYSEKLDGLCRKTCQASIPMIEPPFISMARHCDGRRHPS
jgi:tetratricopeptide (TPR) repeat protein